MSVTRVGRIRLPRRQFRIDEAAHLPGRHADVHVCGAGQRTHRLRSLVDQDAQQHVGRLGQDDSRCRRLPGEHGPAPAQPHYLGQRVAD